MLLIIYFLHFCVSPINSKIVRRQRVIWIAGSCSDLRDARSRRVTADICILFTANDAYVRDYNLIVPSDCVASVEKKENLHALKYIERVLKADTRPSSKINFNKLKKGK